MTAFPGWLPYPGITNSSFSAATATPIEWQIPFKPDTRFRIGSISKQFTAAAILLLQQDGKLKTSDFISRYYPNSPAPWSNITLRNLLTHTSSIPDVDFGLVMKYSPHTPEES